MVGFHPEWVDSLGMKKNSSMRWLEVAKMTSYRAPSLPPPHLTSSPNNTSGH